MCSSPIRISLESKQIVPFSLRQSPLSKLLPLIFCGNFSRDTSCDSVRPIKTSLYVNRGGTSFLSKNPLNFFGKIFKLLVVLISVPVMG